MLSVHGLVHAGGRITPYFYCQPWDCEACVTYSAKGPCYLHEVSNLYYIISYFNVSNIILYYLLSYCIISIHCHITSPNNLLCLDRVRSRN